MSLTFLTRNLTVIILAFVFTLCSCTRVDQGYKVLNMNLGFEPEALDWNIAGDIYSYTIIHKIMHGLTQFSEDAEEKLAVKPALAKSWTISEDGLDYIFEIDERAIWSDKREVLAQDFMDSLTRTLEPSFGAPYAELLQIIDMDRSKVLAKKKLRLSLKYPASYFIYLTASCFMYPIRQDLIDKYGDTWTEADKILSTGPYLLDYWQHEYKIVLKKNPDYFLKDEIENNIDELKFFMVPEQSSAFTLFKNKQFDWIDGGSIPTSEFANLEKCLAEEKHISELPEICRDFDIASSSLLRNTFLGFNVNKKPFDDIRVRKAFAYALDRKAIASLRGRGDIGNATWIPPGLSYFYRKDKQYIFDPSSAQDLLNEAGYSDKSKFPEVIFLYPSREDAKALAEIMHSMWHKNLGVDVKLVAQEWKVFMKTLKDDTPHLYRLSWGADYPEPSTFMQLFTRDNPINYGKWFNQNYEDLVFKGMSSLNIEESKKYYLAAEKILLDQEMGIAPLFVNRQLLLKQANIKNIKPDPMDLVFIDKVQKL